MPSSPNYKRNYKEEYDNYHASAEQRKKRALRNKARKELEDEGRVSKGDGKDVDHKRPLAKGGGNGRGNLRVVPKSDNRSFKRDKKARMK
jgi:hypothetical protein